MQDPTAATKARLDYADLVASFDADTPHVGWTNVSQIRRLTDAELAVCLAANPHEHDDALGDIGIQANDIVEALKGDGALNAAQLIGTAYQVLLTKYLRTRLLHDLDYRAEDTELARRFERPDVDSVNDAAVAP